MPEPSEIVKDKLITVAGIAGYGSASDWSVWIGKQPDKPDRCLTLYDSGGRENPEPSLLLSYPSVQVRIRGKPSDYLEARSKARLVQDVLLGIEPYTHASGDRVSGIISIGEITFLGWDENQRPEHVWNMQIFLEPATNAVTNRMPL